MLNEIEKDWDEDKLKKSDKKNVIITDRTFNLLTGNPEDKLRIHGRFNYQTKWIHDIYVHLLFRNHVRPMPRLTEDIFKASDIKILAEMIDEIRWKVPVISFSDSQARETLGLDPTNFPNEEISRIVRDYAHLRVEGEIHSYWNEEQKLWKKIFLDDSLFGLFRDEPEEKYSHRGHHLDHKYVFVMNVGGLFHFQNLFYHKYSLFKKEFYRLKPGSQNIFRYMAQYQKEALSLDEISWILGYQETVQNKRRRIELVIRYLDELIEKGFIRKYKPEGQGEKTVFHIWRYFPYFREEPKNLLLEVNPEVNSNCKSDTQF